MQQNVNDAVFSFLSEVEKGLFQVAIGYTSWSPLVGIEGSLNSACYISGVLRPVALSFYSSPAKPYVSADNVRPHVAGIVLTFLDAENVQLLPWSAHSPDLLPIENVWSMVIE
ncbi:transposable element Tcb1 transposase [Trichonephila clavipes]|nr:transposable element Tcb1 transposase [Trichonephila clavipes]